MLYQTESKANHKYKADYLQFFKCVSFSLHDCCGYWEGWDPVNRLNHTSWVAIITLTDRPCRSAIVLQSKLLVAFMCCRVLDFCGASEAECHLGITLSVVRLSVFLSARLSVRLSHSWFAYNFFNPKAFIFGIWHVCSSGQDLPDGTIILITWSWPWPLTHI